MKKIINPCVCDTYDGKASAYAEIEYENGRLSIRGVIGPQRNGNCLGSCGQCVEEIRNGKPTDEWNHEMLQRFCDVWGKWHLNDMRPYCEHMKKLGWDEEAKEKIKVAKWNTKHEVFDKAEEAKNRAIQCLKNGEIFVPTSEETMCVNIGYGVTTYNDELPEHLEFYELKKKDCIGRPNVGYKARGWISHKDHPLGFLGKPCPVCGERYGSKWFKEDVPQEIINWLFALPETKITPAWV